MMVTGHFTHHKIPPPLKTGPLGHLIPRDIVSHDIGRPDFFAPHIATIFWTPLR